MRPAVRWPVHPAPLDGEALSSLLSRIAASYQMSLPAVTSATASGPGRT